MKRRVLGFFLISLLIFLPFAFCFLPSAFCQQPLVSPELIANATSYDGKAVLYSGEVVGDIMNRGSFAWVNINDGPNAIGVWMSRGLSSQIGVTGNYRHQGDVVEVYGMLNRACAQHGGDMDIHAQSLTLLRKGFVLAQKDDKQKRVIAGALLLGVLILWILTRSKNK